MMPIIPMAAGLTMVFGVAMMIWKKRILVKE